MGAPVPPVDLSNGKYDEFETMLSEQLGLKVILVRGWETPDSYYNADAMCSFAHTQEELDDARVKFAVVENATLASLRTTIVDRDPDVGHSLSENDLRSLLKVWHVTKRDGNADPEQAVIIFDPGERSRHFPDRDPVLDFALAPDFTNAWDTRIDGSKPPLQVKDFIENFTMREEDVRRYKAVMNLKYALQNQSEYNNLGRGWYYQPFFYNFAQIAGKDSPQMYRGDYEMPYTQVVDKYAAEIYASPEDWGIKDPEFFDKLTLARAIMNLNHHSTAILPFNTFAHLTCRREVTRKEIYEIQENLDKRLDAQLKEHLPAGDNFQWEFYADNDWRILFPLFREVYEKDTSTGPQREYLDTIMEGLQKWFPILTNTPVPKLEENREPQRELGLARTSAPYQPPRKPTL